MRLGARDALREFGPVRRRPADRDAGDHQGRDESQRVIGRALFDRPVESCSDVLCFGNELGDPVELLSAAKMRTGGLRHAYEVVRVPTTERGSLTALLDSFLGVLSK